MASGHLRVGEVACLLRSCFRLLCILPVCFVAFCPLIYLCLSIKKKTNLAQKLKLFNEIDGLSLY